MSTFEQILAEGTERRKAARRVDPIAVDCPHCHALPNVTCKRHYGTDTGSVSYDAKPHVKRLEAAQAVSLFLWRIEQATFKPAELEARQAS